MPDEMQQILCSLVREHGAAALLADANQCRGLLTDKISHHFAQDKLLTERLREVYLLFYAVEEGVAAELQAARTLSPAMQTSLAQRLCERRDIVDHEARWVVATWALALGITVVAPAAPVASATKLSPPPQQLRSTGGAGAVAPPVQSAMPAPRPRQFCPRARTALVLALLGLLFCMYFVLQIFAIKKANEAKKMIADDPNLTGATVAQAALIIGWIEIALAALLWLSIFIQSFSH